jgi:cation transport protein ChaC
MSHAASNTGLWVFGYGSLMWRPGFAYEARVPATLYGAHRSLCVYSHVHRGTPERPGLVLGLSRGGACRGVAFRVAETHREQTIAYLREREQVTSVYLERVRPVRLDDGTDRLVSALTYIADPTHPQFAGDLPLESLLALVRNAHGASGPNAEYVLNTAAHLEELGVRDSRLFALARALSADAPRPHAAEEALPAATPRSRSTV